MRKIVFAVLIVIAIAGIAAWIYQLQTGLIVTNMRNPFSWGLYIAMWAFFVGTAAGGLVVSSAIYIFGAKEFKPIAPVASTTAFIFAVGAMVMILPDLGRVDRIFNMFLYPNFQSMLPWDLVVLSTYALLSAIYTYVLLMPGIAERGILGFGVGGNVEDLKARSERYAKILAPIALPFAILIHTVTAWVLATQLSRAWWYGGLLAPTFIAAAIATGPAVVILASLLVHGYPDRLKNAYGLLAKISAASSAALLFMYYNDFVVRYWWGKGLDFDALAIVFRDYIYIHFLEVFFIILSIVLLAKARSAARLVAGSLSVNMGVLFHRYLLMPPSYNVMPFQIEGWSYPIAVGELRGSLMNPLPVFVDHWAYSPSPVEITIAAGITAILVLTLMLLLRILPVDVEI
ncbi:NrfD/PsrC family molybdoenzyme membrane anchor subunit [Archaeoglobus neptunius]|uniref:NrfD/PsrC family molybdoenzyme membrane anchor subunit n=1 Tax=Archaeoglobus neptunius TaxID=2798580 RepID=UPI0019258563|nr:NrfD/PsrC family molybdoenzyme membrane anchor subunit [Archaeoglobus neptunius]